MKILVTGNPRSGTLSMKRMLRSAGYDVQHERMGEEGTVSCFYFTDPMGPWPREPSFQNRHRNADGTDDVFDLSQFAYRYHLVRNPLKCIPSMRVIVSKTHRAWLEHVGVVDSYLPKITWCAEAWYRTNARIESTLKAKIIRIEDVATTWPRDLDMPKEYYWSHKSSGFKKSVPLARSELSKVTPLHREIVDMARRYGYRI